MLRQFIASFFVFYFVFSFSVFSQDVQVALSSKVLSLGDTMRVDVYTQKKIKKGGIRFANRYFPLSLRASSVKRSQQKTRHYVSYVSLSRKKYSGRYILKLQLSFLNNKSYEKTYKIRVNHQQRPKGKVSLSKKKKSLLKKKRILGQESKLILKAFSTYTPVSYFHRKHFIVPVKGRMSSPFASERQYSGGGRRSHAGVDFANKIGTVVVAPNAGVVIMSRDFAYHGRTIMIDHGLGVVSIFNHLQSRFVETGVRVKRGDQIGALGKSGLVSGPHLHWGLGVHNIRVNPLYWLKNTALVK